MQHTVQTSPLKRSARIILLPLALSLLSACGGTDYQPAPPQAQPIDLSEFAPRVDTFLVLLDTSGSMAHEENGASKAQQAQDMVANFGAAVPDVGFNSGLVIFGKGAGTCMGNGVATKVYGMETFDAGEFQSALGSVGCIRSTTPIVGAVDIATEALTEDAGDIALIIFSDFKWNQPDAVRDAVGALRKDREGALCVHTVRIGNENANAALVNELSTGNDCGSTMSAGDLGDAAAMTAYAADILMSPVAYESYTLSAMTLFDFDKAVLKEAGKAELQKLGDYIRSKGIKVGDIDIIGHTDSIGTQVYNAGLSERRAQAVEAYLISQGVNADIIDVSGMGELDPVASNETESGRAMNRRVEVLVGAASPVGATQ